MPQEQNVEEIKAILGNVLGDSGTKRFSGYLLEEPNIEWRDQKRIENVEEMRRTDGSVSAVLRGLKAPILSSEWSIFCYDDSPKGKEISDFVEKNVFGIARGWKEFLREALAYLDFGFYPFEQIYEIKNGQIHLVDLEPRIPASVQRWKLKDGRPGIVQYIRTDDFNKFEAEIPMEKLFVLTNEKEGDDITGQSILRAAYKHYKYKDVLYRIAGIAADRYGVGVPTGIMPENYGEGEKEAVEEALTNLRSNEKSFMLLPHGFEFSIKTPDGNPQGAQIDTQIDHHNRMIMVSVLAQFLALGSDGSGSLALSQDQSSFFLQQIEEKANYFAAQFNTQVIKRLVDLNYGEQEWYPELKHTSFTEKDMKQLAETLNILVMADLLDPTASVKQWVRPTFKIPEMTDEEMKGEESDEAEQDETDKKEPEPEEDEEALQEKKIIFLAEKPLRLMRKLTQQEDRANLKLLNEQFNETETELEDELSEVTGFEIDRYADSVKKKIDAGDIAGIAGLSFMLLGSTKKSIEKAIKKAYDFGKSGAAKELGIARPSTPLKNQQIMSMDINDLTRAFVYNLEQKSRDLIKDSLITDASAGAVASAVKSKAKDEASRMITNISGTVVGQYVNRGRNNVFQSNLNNIKSFQRSEVLDDSTCAICLSLDERVVKADDPMAQMDTVHSNCRGIWVPIFDEDTEQPEITGIPKSIADSFDLVDGRPSVNAFQQMKKPMNPTNQKTQEIIRRKMGL